MKLFEIEVREENEDQSLNIEPKVKQQEKPQKAWKIMARHPNDQIIGDSTQMVTYSSLICDHLAFFSQVKPKTIDEALCDEN